MKKEEEIRKRLLEENEEFRKLYEEHQLYERKIEELLAKGFLTPEEESEIKVMKKKKLLLKDKMQFIINKHKN